MWDPACPNVWRNQRPLYLFLLNKWYFDEIFDDHFVKPAKELGRLLWKRGDGDVIDGTLNGVAMGLIPFFTRLGVAPVWLYLYLCACDGARDRWSVTWMTLAAGATNGKPAFHRDLYAGWRR